MDTDDIKTLCELTRQGGFEQDDQAVQFCPSAEVAPACGEKKPTQLQNDSVPEIFRARKSGGGEMRLLKTVLTSACERNCNYCAFRAGRDFRRKTLKPDNMADLFTRMNQAGIAEGLFLSSGLSGGGVRTQDRLLDTAEILRLKLGFRGYLHLKIMPGAEKDQVLRAMQLANRVSINLEAPNPSRLKSLAPLKTFADELLQPLRWAAEIRRKVNPLTSFTLHWPSLATQFVVGSVGESDLELLQMSEYLHGTLALSRIYYSRFQPVSGTPFENLPAENPLRELRLYQAGFLLRDYGFTIEDFNFLPDGHLPLQTDPKLAWAQSHLTDAPVEINQADRILLLRIPGIGPLSAKRILKARNRRLIKERGELQKLGVQIERALPYILINGKRPNQQPGLF